MNRNPMSLPASPLFFRALQRAIRAHDGQWRKGNPTMAPPYVVHCVDVANMLCEHARVSDPRTLAIALLHDVLEDTSVTHAELTEEFGVSIADGVLQLTIPEHICKGSDYYKKKHLFQMNSLGSMDTPVQVVKYVDKTCNVRDMLTLPPPWGQKAILGYAQKAKELCDKVSAQIKLPNTLRAWHAEVLSQFSQEHGPL